VSVGPSGFTVSGLVNLGLVVNRIFPESYMGHLGGARLLFRVLSLMAGLWIYGLCIWFFLVSIGAHLQVMKPNDADHHIHFDMTWYSFVFPNTALITATFAVGESLDSHAIRIIGTVLSGLLVCLWIFIFYMMIRALVFRKILWPGRLDGSEISWRKWISGGSALIEEKTSRSSDNTNI
jgi:tellurite resistance protein TehA-like permease